MKTQFERASVYIKAYENLRDSSTFAKQWTQADRDLEGVFSKYIFSSITRNGVTEYNNYRALSYNQKVKYLYDTLYAVGIINPNVRIGLIANAVGESGLDPAVQEGWKAWSTIELAEFNMPAFGLWQHTRSRAIKLIKFIATQKGNAFQWTHIIEPSFQCAFVAKELREGGCKSISDLTIRTDGGIDATLVDQYTTLLVKEFERPSAKHLAATLKVRLNASKAIIKILK